MKSALRKYTPEGEIPQFEDDALKKLSSADLDAIRFIWDETQEGLRCCGVDSYEDWKDATQWVKNHSGDVPGVMTAYYLLIHSLCSTRLIIFTIIHFISFSIQLSFLLAKEHFERLKKLTQLFNKIRSMLVCRL